MDNVSSSKLGQATSYVNRSLTFGLLGLLLGLGGGLGILLLLGRDGAHRGGVDVADRKGFRVANVWGLLRSWRLEARGWSDGEWIWRSRSDRTRIQCRSWLFSAFATRLLLCGGKTATVRQFGQPERSWSVENYSRHKCEERSFIRMMALLKLE